MSFIWPTMLLSLLLLPVAVALYIRQQRRRRELIASYGSLGVVREIGGRPGGGRRIGWRRHTPPVLFLIALALLLVALARPQTTVSLPKVAGTVILAFDVSGSMAADDIKPTRMEAAKVAARDFVALQPQTVRVGVVAFSDSGITVQAPTNDQGVVVAAINRLTPSTGTSLGNGILVSLNTIATAESGEQTNYYRNLTPTVLPTPTPVAKGTHTSAVIVVLTDGENTAMPDPLAAAKTAANRGVRIYTVGIGSPAGAVLKINGFSVQTQLDEATLKQIAQATDGAYYNAPTAEDLQAIYGKLGSQLTIKPEKIEVTALFSGAGLLVLLIGGICSLLWFSRLP